MALPTDTTIKIGKLLIENFSRLEIVQQIHEHHVFTLEIGQDLLETKFQSAVPASQNLMGQEINIEIKPIPDLDSLKLLDNKEFYSMQFNGIIKAVELKKSTINNTEEILIIKGYSKTILLDNGPDSNSFTKMTLSDIVNRIKSGYGIDIAVKPFYNDILAYTVQYNESDFAFLNRLAMRHGQWLYDNGVKIIFGSPGSSGQANELVYDLNMQDFNYKMELVPSLFKIIENDNRKGDTSIDTTAKYSREADGFHQTYIEKSNQIFNKETVIQLNQNAVGGNGKNASEEYAKNKMREIVSGMMQVQATTEVPGIILGNILRLKGVDKQLESNYRVTQITHICDDGGGYENHFTAINFSGAVFSPKTNPDLIPRCQSQTAVVMANNDPDGLSAVVVQMPWQKEKGLTTPYIPMLQHYGGNEKGMHWIPEIGDTVFVDFQGGNAEMPIVTGTMTSTKEKSGYATPDNDIKALHTRSNNLLVMNDKTGSVLLQDSSKSFIEMDGKRKIEVNKDIFVVNAKKIILNATESTEIQTNDYLLNALSRIYILSKTMKQTIQGFMSMYSGKALINSNDTIDIEAKVTKLHGTEQALMHSDKEAVINSAGTAKMHGASGNSLTNTAKTISASPTDSVALAVVYFRPLSTWKGEFGFDWLREKDNGLNTEPDYESIVESGYKDGISNLTNIEAFSNLKLEYRTIPITRKITSGTSTTEYLVPYLTLFSKEFVDTLPKPIFAEPRFEAELKLLIDIEEDLDKLKFDYDDALFELSEIILTEKAKTNGLEDKNIKIKIKCLKDLDRNHDINIYAYPKGVTIASRATLEPNIDKRKLAGKITVLKNDVTARKEGKFALIRVKTNVAGIPVAGLAVGSFSSAEKVNLYNALHQALIVPVVEEVILDLSTHADFTGTGKHLTGTNIKYSYAASNGVMLRNPTLYSDCQNNFLNATDSAGTFINAKYNGYFTIFKFGINSNKFSVLGAVEEIGVSNVIMFTLIGGDDCTLNHETLHGLGLCHSHRDHVIIPNNRSNYIYTYPNALASAIQPVPNPLHSTDNVMCYRSIAYTTWRWQWKIINSNIT